MVVKSSPIPGQGTLFEQSTFTGYMEIPIDPATQAPEPRIGFVPAPSAPAAGPTVNLIERAEQLKIVTDNLARINRTSGLAKALDTPQGQRIHARYENDAHHILHKAEAIHDSRMLAAKHAFARASGMWAMIEAGVSTEEEAKAATHSEWMDFMAIYADSNQPARLRLRKQQEKLVKTLTKPTQQ